jgi:hypothetical protein
MGENRQSQTFRIFIGSDNQTGKLEKDRIKSLVNREFDGYTFLDAVGIWKGKEENTAIVEIVTEDKDKIDFLVRNLKADLNQEAILLQTLLTNSEFI